MASNVDTSGASSTPPRAPAVSVDFEHVYCQPKTPSTPYRTPTHPTQALGEQNAVPLSCLRVEHVARVRGKTTTLGRRSRDRRSPLNPVQLTVGARARAALARGGLAKPRRAGDLGQIWPMSSLQLFFSVLFSFSCAVESRSLGLICLWMF